MWLANDGNYRELRWFTTWKHHEELVEFRLPAEIAEAISQDSVPFGYGYMQFIDTYATSSYNLSFNLALTLFTICVNGNIFSSFLI